MDHMYGKTVPLFVKCKMKKNFPHTKASLNGTLFFRESTSIFSLYLVLISKVALNRSLKEQTTYWVKR